MVFDWPGCHDSPPVGNVSPTMWPFCVSRTTRKTRISPPWRSTLKVLALSWPSEAERVVWVTVTGEYPDDPTYPMHEGEVPTFIQVVPLSVTVTVWASTLR